MVLGWEQTGCPAPRRSVLSWCKAAISRIRENRHRCVPLISSCERLTHVPDYPANPGEGTLAQRLKAQLWRVIPEAVSALAFISTGRVWHKLVNCGGVVSRCEMRIAYRHCQGLVAEEFSHSADIYSSHHQPACERVPEAMPSETLDPGIFQAGLNQPRALTNAAPSLRLLGKTSSP